MSGCVNFDAINSVPRCLKRVVATFCRQANAVEVINLHFHTNKGDTKKGSIGHGRGVNFENPEGKIKATIEAVGRNIQVLMAVSAQINRFFGLRILFAMLSGFVCVTVQSYYLIMHLRVGLDEKEQIYALCSCSLLAIHLAEFGAILAAGEKVKAEVRTEFRRHDVNLKVSSSLGSRLDGRASVVEECAARRRSSQEN